MDTKNPHTVAGAGASVANLAGSNEASNSATSATPVGDLIKRLALDLQDSLYLLDSLGKAVDDASDITTSEPATLRAAGMLSSFAKLILQQVQLAQEATDAIEIAACRIRGEAANG